MTIAELQKRSNSFVTNLYVHIAEIVEGNEELIKLNQEQLQRSRTSEGKPLVNRRTGSARYSPAYARFKGYQYPDLYLTGNTYKEMDVIVNENAGEYFLTSFADVTKYLVEMYGGEIFGINDKTKAQRIVVPLLRKRFQQIVLR